MIFPNDLLSRDSVFLGQLVRWLKSPKMKAYMREVANSSLFNVLLRLAFIETEAAIKTNPGELGLSLDDVLGRNDLSFALSSLP